MLGCVEPMIFSLRLSGQSVWAGRRSVWPAEIYGCAWLFRTPYCQTHQDLLFMAKHADSWAHVRPGELQSPARPPPVTRSNTSGSDSVPTEAWRLKWQLVCGYTAGRRNRCLTCVPL